MPPESKKDQNLPQVSQRIDPLPPLPEPKNDELLNKIQSQLLEETKEHLKTNPNPPLTANINAPGQASQIELKLPATRKGGKSSKLITFLVTFIIFLICSTYAYAFMDYPLINPPQNVQNLLDKAILFLPGPKPTRIILETAIVKSANLKSADIKSEINLFTEADNAPIRSIKLTLEGPVDFKDKVNQSAEADVAAEVEFEGASFSASASVKTIGNTLYFRINEFPFGAFYSMFADYKNKWFYIQTEDDQFQQSSINNEKLKSIVTKFIENSKQKIEIKSEDNIYILEISPPKKELNDFLYDVATVYANETKDELSSSIQKEDFLKLTEKLNNIKITIGIDKKTYYLQMVNISSNVIIEDFSLPPGLGAETLPTSTNTEFTFDFLVELSSYNKNVVIVPPENAEDFEKFTEEAFGNFYKNLNQQELPVPQEDENELENLDLENDLNLNEEETNIFKSFLEEDTSVLGDKKETFGLLLKLLNPPKSN